GSASVDLIEGRRLSLELAPLSFSHLQAQTERGRARSGAGRDESARQLANARPRFLIARVCVHRRGWCPREHTGCISKDTGRAAAVTASVSGTARTPPLDLFRLEARRSTRRPTQVVGSTQTC